MKEEKVFYVYCLISSIDNEVFYIGKGSGTRAYEHLREGNLRASNNEYKVNKIRKIRRKGGEVKVSKIKKGLREKDAFELEEFIISEIGLENLTNMTGGGEGESLSEEMKENLRQKNLGKELSEETKRKLSEAHKGREFSEETRKKMSRTRRGEGSDHALLDRKDASEILWLLENTKYRFVDIGILYGATKSIVQSIYKRESWSHIKPKTPPKEIRDTLKGSPTVGDVRSPNLKKEVVRGIKWLIEYTNLEIDEIADLYNLAEITVSQMRSKTYHEDVTMAEPPGYTPWGRIFYSVVVKQTNEDHDLGDDWSLQVPTGEPELIEAPTPPVYNLLRHMK